MTRYYDTLAEFERDGFTVIVDKTWEDTSPEDLFDDSVTDIKQMCRDINSGGLDWFMLRVRAFVDGLEMGSSIVGGYLYADARDVLKDGTAEDLIYEAIEEAKKNIYPLMKKLQAINEAIEQEGVVA